MPCNRHWRTDTRRGLRGGIRPAAAGARRTVAALATLCVLLVPSVALACPICFQVEDAQTINGIRAGVIVLMSVTVVVLTAVAAFSIRLWRNEKDHRSDA